MRKRLISVMLIILAAASWAAGQETRQSSNKALEDDVGKFLRRLLDAYSAREAAGSIDVIADGGFFFHSDAGYSTSEYTREELRSAFASKATASLKETYEIRDLQVVPLGSDIAIANYSVISIDPDTKTERRRERTTNILVRRNGQWLVFADHTSKMPKPAEAAVRGMPVGWIRFPQHSGAGYAITVESGVKRSGNASVSIRLTCAGNDEFGAIAQEISAEDYLGKRVRLSGWLKTDSAEHAGLWMRVDGKNRLLGFDNMMNRPVKGTTDWRPYQVTLDVPPEAVNVVFGVLIGGEGTVWADDLTVEIVGPGVAVTNLLSPEQTKLDDPKRDPKKATARRPENLGFENGVIQ